MNAHAVEASDSESDESANSSTRPYEKVNIWWARSDLNRDAFAAASKATVSANFTTRPFVIEKNWWVRSDLNRDAFAVVFEATVYTNSTTDPEKNLVSAARFELA